MVEGGRKNQKGLVVIGRMDVGRDEPRNPTGGVDGWTETDRWRRILVLTIGLPF